MLASTPSSSQSPAACSWVHARDSFLLSCLLVMCLLVVLESWIINQEGSIIITTRDSCMHFLMSRGSRRRRPIKTNNQTNHNITTDMTSINQIILCHPSTPRVLKHPSAWCSAQQTRGSWAVHSFRKSEGLRTVWMASRRTRRLSCCIVSIIRVNNEYSTTRPL